MSGNHTRKVDDTMKKLLLSSVAALSVLNASAASARDLLLAVIQGKDGKPQAHYQLIQGECALLITKFREQAQRGLPIVLTFEAPPKVTGKVLEAVCILPDGSIGERFKAPDILPM